jgi:hypothetical protein
MLTDAQCRNALVPPAPSESVFLTLEACTLRSVPAGSRRWFWKYRKDGKEGRLALGSYPQVSLTAARKARDVARLQKSEGIDPAKARKLEKLVNPTGFDTFKAVALEWYGKQVRAGVQVMQSECFVSWSVTCSRGLVIGNGADSAHGVTGCASEGGSAWCCGDR